MLSVDWCAFDFLFDLVGFNNTANQENWDAFE